MAVPSTHSISPTTTHVVPRSFFDDVPVDIVREIMRKLPLSNIPRLAEISRRWNGFVNNDKTIRCLLIHHLDRISFGTNKNHQDLNLWRYFKSTDLNDMTPGLRSQKTIVFRDLVEHTRKIVFKRLVKNWIAFERRTNKALKDCVKLNAYRYRVPIKIRLVPYQFSPGLEDQKPQVFLYVKKMGVNADPSLSRVYHNLLVDGKEKFEFKRYSLRAESGPRPEKPLEPLKDIFYLPMGDENLVFVPCFDKEKYLGTKIYLNGKKVVQITRKIFGTPLFYSNKLLLLCDRKKPDLYQFKIWDFDRTNVAQAAKVAIFIANSLNPEKVDMSSEIFKT